MAVTISNKMIILALIGLIAVILFGVLLGVGLFALGAALVLRMSPKWKFALLVIAAILIALALAGRLV